MSILAEGKTPEEWAALLAERSIPVSVRTLREAANRIGACHKLGRAMIITPDQMDMILQEGHPEQWVKISHAMMVELANLKPKRPVSRTGKPTAARVFGYATVTGYRAAWKTICTAAGIEYLSAHAAGRHGFYTELRVRQGVDPITAARAGRWSDPGLPDRVYAHAEADEGSIRERIRTPQVQTEVEDQRKEA